MTGFLIWGAGGHGKVVADVVRATGHAVYGFIDRNPDKLGQIVEPGGVRVVIGEEEFIAALAKYGALPHGAYAVALAIGENIGRMRALAALGGAHAPAVVHPTACVSPSAHLGRGTVVFPGAVVNAAALVHAAVILNTGSVVEHDCEIGAGVHLSPGATLCGGVQVGEGSWIGAGATVISGVRVGRGARIGAGAAVVRDVVDDLTVVGVPARPRAS